MEPFAGAPKVFNWISSCGTYRIRSAKVCRAIERARSQTMISLTGQFAFRATASRQLSRRFSFRASRKCWIRSVGIVMDDLVALEDDAVPLTADKSVAGLLDKDGVT